MAAEPKSVVFCGTSLSDLRTFPQSARRAAGFQLDRIQHGSDPAHWKPMRSVGPNVREIRIRDADGAFRVIYIASLRDAIYVLHCFQKKTQRTAQSDIDLANQRYKQVLKDMKR